MLKMSTPYISSMHFSQSHPPHVAKCLALGQKKVDIQCVWSAHVCVCVYQWACASLDPFIWLTDRKLRGCIQHRCHVAIALCCLRGLPAPLVGSSLSSWYCFHLITVTMGLSFVRFYILQPVFNYSSILPVGKPLNESVNVCNHSQRLSFIIVIIYQSWYLTWAGLGVTLSDGRWEITHPWGTFVTSALICEPKWTETNGEPSTRLGDKSRWTSCCCRCQQRCTCML